MTRIPRTALVIGIIGLLPFITGAIIASGTSYANMGDLEGGGYPLIVPNDGVKLLTLYGTIILSFMSGVLWGFAAKAEGPIANTGYILAALPTIWALMARGGTDSDTSFYLIFGYIGLLTLDWLFFRQGITPPYWMKLRIPLTLIAITCLAIGAYA